MPKISELPTATTPSLNHVGAFNLKGETQQLSIGQIRDAMDLTADIIKYDGGDSVENVADAIKTNTTNIATNTDAIKQNTDDITTLKSADKTPKSVDQNVWNTGTSEIEAVISPVKLTNKIKDMFSGGGASGWSKLPNGLIIQVGEAPANSSGSTTITFPVKFPTKLISFAASALVGNNTAVSIGYTDVTTYSVLAKPRFSENSIATEGFTYIAIGY